MKVKAFITIWLAVMVSACTWLVVEGQNIPDAESELTVFAAASLAEAFSQTSDSFQVEHPDIKITLNFAGSQQLAQQLAQGAPADVFASADMTQMQAAIQSDRVIPEYVRVFAHNRLVVIYPQDNPGNLDTLQDLANPGVKLILAAKAVPVGQYSQEFLHKASFDSDFGIDFENKVLENVVSYEESVRAVLSKTILGEADAGIVYKSDISAKNTLQLGQLEIPEQLNVLASYYIAPVSDSHQKNSSNLFIDYVLSTTGQTILSDFGLIPVQ